MRSIVPDEDQWHAYRICTSSSACPLNGCGRWVGAYHLNKSAFEWELKGEANQKVPSITHRQSSGARESSYRGNIIVRSDFVRAGRKVQRAAVEVRALLELRETALEAGSVVRYAITDASQVRLEVPPTRKRWIVDVSCARKVRLNLRDYVVIELRQAWWQHGLVAGVLKEYPREQRPV